jgi:hypothetical protein
VGGIIAMFQFSFRRRRKLEQPKQDDGQKVALEWRRLKRRSTAESDTTLVEQFHSDPSPPDIVICGKERQSSIEFTSLPRPPQKWHKSFRKIKLSASSILLTSITIGEATDIPYLKGLAGLVLVIYNAVEVRVQSLRIVTIADRVPGNHQ